MDAPTDKEEGKFSRIRFACGACKAEHRPKQDRWTALDVVTQWVKASREVGRLGWRIMRHPTDPHTIRLCCPTCVEAGPAAGPEHES